MQGDDLKRASIAILFVLMLQCVPAMPAGASYQVSLNASGPEEAVKLDQVFKYTLAVVEYGETGKRTRLVEPDFSPLVVEGATRKSKTQVINGKASREMTVTFALSAREPGEYTVEPAKFLLEDPVTGNVQEMVSNPVTVTVLDEKPGIMDDIRDIKEPKTFFDRVKRVFYVLIGLGALTAIAVLGITVWAVRRRRKAPRAEMAEPAVNPRDAALEALKAAERQMSDPREFYTAVTDALRGYLRDARKMHATEATTTELMRMCRAARMEPDTVELVRAVFTEADLAKFAKYVPSQERMTADLERARKLVMRV